MLYTVLVYPPRHVHIPQILQSMAIFMLLYTVGGHRQAYSLAEGVHHSIRCLCFPSAACTHTTNAAEHGCLHAPVYFGRLPYSTMPLALAATSYSLLLSMPTLTMLPVPSHDPHMWHSRRFLDRWGNSIYCPAFSRQGVHKLSQLTPAHIHTYKSAYRLAWRNLRKSAEAPAQRYHQPSFWAKWLSHRVATKLAPVKGINTGKGPTTWHRLHNVPIPHAHKHFIYEALWHKLRTGFRRRHWLPHQQLRPIAGTYHTHKHALITCANLVKA